MKTLRQTAREIAAHLTDPAEAKRLARRAEIRAQLAAAAAEKMRYRTLSDSIATQNSRIDQLAADHAAKLEPTQRELSALDDQIAVAMGTGEAAKPAIESRRLELLRQIASANAELEIKLMAERRIVSRLMQERNQLIENPSRADENLLAREDAARPEYILKQFLLDNASRWLEKRAGEARNKVAQIETALHNELRPWQPAPVTKFAYSLPANEPNQAEVNYLQKHLSRWRAELREVETLIAANLRESDELHRMMVDE